MVQWIPMGSELSNRDLLIENTYKRFLYVEPFKFFQKMLLTESLFSTFYEDKSKIICNPIILKLLSYQQSPQSLLCRSERVTSVHL